MNQKYQHQQKCNQPYGLINKRYQSKYQHNKNYNQHQQSMIQIGCRLWNVSLIIVLILTLCNIILTVRLLHSECPHPVIQMQSSQSQDMIADNSGMKQINNSKNNKKASSSLTSSSEMLNEKRSLNRKNSKSEKLNKLCPPNTICTSINNNSNNDNITEKGFFDIDPRLGHWDSRRLYKMFDGVVIGNKYVDTSQKYLTCLATQSSIEKLSSIVEVSLHWTGPISLALYAAGDLDYKLLKGYVKYLRRCYPSIKDRVIFHLIFPSTNVPNVSNETESTEYMDCQHPDMALNKLLEMRSANLIRWKVRNPYPQNHLRNLARKNCQTDYVFLTDVDIIPSNNLAQELNVFLRKTKCNSGKCAYVIPTFELDERVKYPRNKTDLIRLAGKGLARPFHQKVFIFNQHATNTSRWMKDNSTNELHISHNVTNFEFLYEPFYVALDTVPQHDERFIGYGFTRNTQVYEMHIAGYTFQVLSPVFNCHWGLQVRKTRPSWREMQNSRNRRNFEGFRKEIHTKYNKVLPIKKPPVAKQPPPVLQKQESKNNGQPVIVAVAN